MKATDYDSTRGILHVDGFIDDQCYSSWKEFVEALPTLLSVELPPGYSGVIVQPQQPSEDDKNKLWLRTDSNGGADGLYAFQQGTWHLLYTGAPQQVTWMYGDSSKLDGTGYVLIDQGDTQVPPHVVSVLKASYIASAHDPTVFSYFATRYEGF